jgi:hypothetical protein
MAERKGDSMTDHRLMFCLLHGMPIPDGGKLSPPADGPIPHASDPAALARVRDRIAGLKAGTFTSYSRLPAGQDAVALMPGEKGTWQELTEPGRLAVLDFWVDWDGVSLLDRRAELAAHVDIPKLPPEYQVELRDVMMESAAEHAPGNQQQEAIGEEPGRVRFQDFDCRVEFVKYANGRPGLVLLDAVDGQEVAVATVNVPDAHLGLNEVVIKDYSENDGMLAALEKAGIVRSTGRSVACGFVTAPICELLVSPLEEKHHKQSLADLKAEANKKQPGRAKSRDKDMER